MKNIEYDAKERGSVVLYKKDNMCGIVLRTRWVPSKGYYHTVQFIDRTLDIHTKLLKQITLTKEKTWNQQER